MNIVTTSVHDALIAGAVSNIIELFDRQSVHVGPDCDCLSLANIDNDACSADTCLRF